MPVLVSSKPQTRHVTSAPVAAAGTRDTAVE
jgi:hypothetical protein